MKKLFRVGMSFAIVLVAYWAYALVVVPVIVPSLDPNDGPKISPEAFASTQDRANLQSQELAALFPPGSWELVNKPKVLESDQAKLLIGDYKTLPDGRVLLKPCTIIFFPKKELQEAPIVERQPIILEAPEGALLQFDSSFDLSRAQFGNLIGGFVAGPVTIRGLGDPNDPEDDLRITTRNIQLSEQLITTNEPVRFQYGKHRGAGQRMRIELEQKKKDRTWKKSQGPQIAGIRSFQLRKVDYLRLFVPEEIEEKSGVVTSSENLEPKLIPVDVECTGEFRFDVAEHRAAFKDDVVISRFRIDGAADQLFCDELVIHFDSRKNKAATAAKPRGKKNTSGGIGGLEPSWLEARGIKRPATIRSTVDKVEAMAREIQYHLADRRIVLQDESGKEPVRLNQENNTFIAKYLEYRPELNQADGPGQLVADGPGIVRARLNKESDQLFTATWQKELRLRPHEKNQVLSLTGGATLDYGVMGKMSANAIHFFLIQKPGVKSRSTGPGSGENGLVGNGLGENVASNLQPDRMQADGDVRIESKELTAFVEQFQIWFEMAEHMPANLPQPGATAAGVTSATSATAGTPATYAIPGTPGVTTAPFGMTASTGPRVATAPGAGFPVAGTPKPEKKQHFHITGRVLQANVLLREVPTPDGKKKQDTEVTKLTILDNVKLVETATDKPDEEPIVAKGDQIHVIDATLPSAAINLFGRPAEFIGRGLGLAGANISLNRGTNELSVDGPGTMRLPPMDRDLQGRPVAKAEPLFINWQRSMNFDGQTIHFVEQVFAKTESENQKLYTEQLTATLSQRIDFSKTDKAVSPNSRPDLLRLSCHGGAKFDSNTLDTLGRLEATEQAEVTSLVIDRSSGKVYAQGPGYVRTVRSDKDGKMFRQLGPTGMTTARPQAAYGSAQGPTAPSGPGMTNGMTVNPATSNPATDENKLLYFKIRFQGFIDGDINGKLMSFNEQVRGTFGQVLDWNQNLTEDNADLLGDEGGLLRCRRLQLVQMPSPTGGDPNVEMEATGNVSIEGSQFTARGTRAGYSREKELLILEGDGRTEAMLFMQDKVGAPPKEISANKVMYWPKLKQYSLGGSQSIQFPLNPGH